MKRAVIFTFVLALAAATLAFAGCGDGGSSLTPEQVVGEFLSAAMEGNADVAYDLITEDSKSEVGDKENLVAGFSDSVSKYEVGKGTVSGERASVPVSYELQGFDGGIEFDTILKQENGSWKISLSDTNAAAEEALNELMQEFETEQ